MEDIIGLGQNFKANGNLGGLASLKPSKSKISNIRGLPMNEIHTHIHRFTGRERI
jgi:hypothetical protein